MIDALFLSCALAASPAIAFPSQTYGKALRLVTDSARFSIRILRTDKRVLMVGGDPSWVELFRAQGMAAFGALTQDRPGATPFHVVADPGDLPFGIHLFQTVYWQHPNPLRSDFYAELTGAAALIEASGFLIFDEDAYPYWPDRLVRCGWMRLPFLLGELSIYQAHGNGNFLRRTLPSGFFPFFRRAILGAA